MDANRATGREVMRSVCPRGHNSGRKVGGEQRWNPFRVGITNHLCYRPSIPLPLPLHSLPAKADASIRFSTWTTGASPQKHFASLLYNIFHPLYRQSHLSYVALFCLKKIYIYVFKVKASCGTEFDKWSILADMVRKR